MKDLDVKTGLTLNTQRAMGIIWISIHTDQAAPHNMGMFPRVTTVLRLGDLPADSAR